MNADEFIPLDLNEANVARIFKECSINKQTPKKNYSLTLLFPKGAGWDEKKEVFVPFDANALRENKKAITYLFGQLQQIHIQEPVFLFGFAAKKYNNFDWTHNKSYILALLNLACNREISLITPFFLPSNYAHFLQESIVPTLSPKDPNFPAWWAEHKKEWID